MQKILIVAVNASEKFGGEAILPVHYFRELRKRGCDVRLLVHERTRNELHELFADDWERIYFIRDYPIHRMLQRLRRMLPTKIGDFSLGTLMVFLTQVLQRQIAKSIIKSHGITVVHQPTPVSPKTPSFFFALGAPVIIGPMNGGMKMPEGYADRSDSKWYTNLFVFVGRLCSEAMNVVIPGKYLADTLLVANARTRHALPKFRSGKVVEIVENGVDPQRFSFAEPREEANAPVQLCFLGRLVSWKGVDILLTAFARLPDTCAELNIVGDGSERRSLEALAERLGISQRVRFHGFVPQRECASLLEKMTFLVLPSLYECGGAVVLEAMAKGLPVIASNWGGPADYIDDSTGLLVDPSGGPDMFTERLITAIRRYMDDPDLRACHVRNARNKVIAKYSWGRKIDDILRIYDDASPGNTYSKVQKLSSNSR